jgi:hypothetical protein
MADLCKTTFTHCSWRGVDWVFKVEDKERLLQKQCRNTSFWNLVL